MMDKFKEWKIILGSASPRRKQLLEGIGIPFEIITTDIEETYPDNLTGQEIAEYLSKKKAISIFHKINIDNKTIILTADTIVWFNSKVIGKPSSKEEAIYFLNLLSGNMHYVYTGFTLYSKNLTRTCHSETKVFFKKFTEEEIKYYVETYKPYDKAGSYGAQEWLGFIGIEKIEGSYFNVMGLPTCLLWKELNAFINQLSKL